LFSGGTETQVVGSPNDKDERFSFKNSTLNQQLSSIGMSGNFSSTGSSHETETHIITGPSSMGSSEQYPDYYVTGSNVVTVVYPWKEKLTVLPYGLTSQVTTL